MPIETPDGRAIKITIHRTKDDGAVMVIQDVTERRNAQREINRMALFDPVTELPNRRCFEEELALVLHPEQSLTDGLTVMFLDLDDFKQVNDSLGHRTGDKLLVEIARRLSAIIGPRDLVARWGGDEFVILHHHAPAQSETPAVAKRIIDEINRAVVIDGSEVIVGASIGSASAPDDGISPDALLSKADIALYAAKADGRRVWRAFEPAMDAKIQIRRLIELELRTAVAGDGIDVHFQPIVAVGTRRIVGFEALARWQSAVLGSISPTEFIPIVEEIGLMEEMGAAVLRRACQACAAWPDGVSVSVNLSSTQFRNGNLEKTILGALAAANLAPERLDLEITESTLLDDRGDTRRALQDLRARGLRISLDDFGTGYSSLSIGRLISAKTTGWSGCSWPGMHRGNALGSPLRQPQKRTKSFGSNTLRQGRFLASPRWSMPSSQSGTNGVRLRLASCIQDKHHARTRRRSISATPAARESANSACRFPRDPSKPLLRVAAASSVRRDSGQGSRHDA
jgi:diguanylate cyclase (GGDEF)-like protein